jgi:pimeloyl-ACP methyl ester carboxylesterase
VGNSFGASIVLRLAAARPELFRSLIVHEPPLFGLLKDGPKGKQALAAVQERMSAVAALLAGGDWTGGARLFVETIAFGPNAWPKLPEEVRTTFVYNAPTWLDEVQDPEALHIDLSGLRGFAARSLLTIWRSECPGFSSRCGSARRCDAPGDAADIRRCRPRAASEPPGGVCSGCHGVREGARGLTSRCNRRAARAS